MAAGRTAGWFDAAEDLDWYRLDLAAGQRVHVELQAGRLGDQRPLMKLLAPDGSVLQLTPSLHAGPADLQVFSAAAPVAGAYRLLVAAPSAAAPALPLPYMLSVSSIAPDAEPDRRADALPLVAEQPRSASFDQTGDRDSFAVDAAAGQRVLFEVFGVGLQVTTYTARLYGPADRDLGLSVPSSLSQVRFVTRAEAAGRYTLELQSRAELGGPGTATPVGYTVTARLLDADDHPDAPAAAEPLTIGQAARGVLDLPGDQDAFAVELTAGQRYAFELGSAPRIAALRLYDGAGTLLREARPTASASASMSFEPDASGRYVLRAEAPLSVTAGALGDGRYELRTAALGADDLPGRLAAAPALELGASRALSFDRADDLDVVRFFARAGERFTVALTNAAGAPVAAALGLADGTRPLPPTLADRADGRLHGVATQDGWHYALVSPTSASAASGAFGGRFELRVDARAADDHGDAPAVGTPIAVGEPSGGRVDLGGDVDWFRVELAAGQRYRFTLTIPDADLAIGVSPDLMLADLAGRDLYAEALGARGNAASRFVFTPEASGVYALRPAGVASYTLRVDAVGADDVADLASAARPLDVAAAYQALGMEVQGTDAAEQFIGGSRADVFFGGGGADLFVGGPGNDRFDGGPGIDSARYPGTRQGLAITREGGGWTVQDRPGGLGTDTLIGIERLLFDGQRTAVALDLDGNAGVVAKLIGALFGPSWLARTDVVGAGLALIDGGMTPLELAQAAAASSLFAAEAGSNTNRDFVFEVYTNVFGRPPGSADLQAYAALLDRGSFTQGALALLAADSAPNLANIGFTGLAASGIEYVPG